MLRGLSQTRPIGGKDGETDDDDSDDVDDDEHHLQIPLRQQQTRSIAELQKGPTMKSKMTMLKKDSSVMNRSKYSEDGTQDFNFIGDGSETDPSMLD